MDHPFLKGFADAHVRRLAATAEIRELSAGEYLWRQGQQVDAVAVVVSGEVSLEITVPNQGPLEVDFAAAGDVLGCWLLGARPEFDARAIAPVRAVLLDGAGLRAACDEDPVLGYELAKRILPETSKRLNRTRWKLIDSHGL